MEDLNSRHHQWDTTSNKKKGPNATQGNGGKSVQYSGRRHTDVQTKRLMGVSNPDLVVTNIRDTRVERAE